MAISFPINPSVGQYYTAPNTVIYRYDGSKWSGQVYAAISGPAGSPGAQGPSGPQGPQGPAGVSGNGGPIFALTPGAIVQPNLAQANNFSLTANQNFTLAFPLNPTPGQAGTITIKQDATGGRVITWGGGWECATSQIGMVLSTTANATDVFNYYVENSGEIFVYGNLKTVPLIPSFVMTLDISGYNFNVKSEAIARGWNQTDALIATLTVQSTDVLGATSNAVPAFATGTGFPPGTSISLTNYGYIVGKGGDGVGGAAALGGNAITANIGMSISNYGTIGGGGGGGSRGLVNHPDARFVAGGGGAGAVPGASPVMDGGSGGSVGTLTIGGAGLGPVKTTNPQCGAGGNLGMPGGPGGNFNNGGDSPYDDHGAGGAAVVGDSNISWSLVGTRLGAIL